MSTYEEFLKLKHVVKW